MLRKIVLSNTNTSQFPFQSIDESSEIEKIGFNISQTYSLDGKKSFLDHIDFFHHVQMILNADSAEYRLDVQTRDMLYFYDRSEQFVLPLYNGRQEYSDYGKISITPYDLKFWEDSWGFKFSSLEHKRVGFPQREGVLMNFRNAWTQHPTSSRYLK